MAEEKKKSTKKILLIVGLVLLIPLLCCGGLAIGGVFNSDSNSNSKSLTDQTKTEEVSDDTGKTEKKEELEVYEMNKEIELGKLKFKVTNAENLGDSITQSWGEPITTSGKFIRVDYEVENLAKESTYMGELELTDDQGRTFSESDKKYSILGDDAEFLDELNPNIKTEYSTVFDVAKDAENLKLKINDFGLFNFESAYVKLGL